MSENQDGLPSQKTHVIHAATFSSFVEEILPGSTVRLAGWSEYKPCGTGIGLDWRIYTLGLSGVNLDGDIVMLTTHVPVQLSYGERWKGSTPDAQAVIDAWPGMEQLVRDFLEGDGYPVRDGIHAISRDLTTFNGTFEVVRWDKESRCYVYDEAWCADEAIV